MLGGKGTLRPIGGMIVAVCPLAMAKAIHKLLPFAFAFVFVGFVIVIFVVVVEEAVVVVAVAAVVIFAVVVVAITVVAESERTAEPFVQPVVAIEQPEAAVAIGLVGLVEWVDGWVGWGEAGGAGPGVGTGAGVGLGVGANCQMKRKSAF